MNVNKLRGKIVENGMTIEKFAERIGINRSTLYRRLGGGTCERFTVGEVRQMSEVLNLSSQDVVDIFFGRDVA